MAKRIGVSRLGESNELSEGIPCKCCKEIMFFVDDLVFLLGNEVVSVSEQHPDWDTAICTTCAEDNNLI
jgi:hypothetical protein